MQPAWLKQGIQAYYLRARLLALASMSPLSIDKFGTTC